MGVVGKKEYSFEVFYKYEQSVIVVGVNSNTILLLLASFNFIFLKKDFAHVTEIKPKVNVCY